MAGDENQESFNIESWGLIVGDERQESFNMESQGLIALDGSVDLKGRPVLRSKTGKWKACSFVVAYEVFERMAYYGIASNLVIYLTDKLHEDTVSSSSNVSNWSGTIWITPVIGAYIADSFLIYIQDRVGFSVGYAIPTVGLIISVILFLIGTPFYRHKVQNGNPFDRMAQVIVAAVRKWRVNVPSDPTELHEVDPKAYVSKGRFPIAHTPVLRFLDKAATKDGPVLEKAEKV